jgi:glycosyltransferase involved in cell wall biosynthesis
MRLKVLYILPPTRSYAGIERVIDEICSEIAGRYGGEIDLDVLYTSAYKGANDHPAYNKIQHCVRGRLDLMRTVRRVARRKDYQLVVVPQVESTVLYWLSCLGTGKKFVLYLHGNPRCEMSHLKAKIMFFVMRTVVLRRLAAVFGTSPKQLRSFRALFPHRAPHFWVPNPVRTFDDADQQRPPGEGVTFVKVGRFAYQKGHDILLRAFAQVHAARGQARLVLVGYGADEPALRAQITALGLDEAVRIAYLPHSPGPALAAADVYVSASRWEGWSLAICEALRFGLPVVATDCEFGPSDILTDPRLGRLTPPGDEAALAAGMIHYCDHLEEARADAAFRRAYVQRFDAGAVVHVHAEALAAAARRPARPQAYRATGGAWDEATPVSPAPVGSALADLPGA